MNEEMRFTRTLEELLKTAGQQGGMVTQKQVSEAVEKAGVSLGEQQLSLVYDYLKAKKIGIGEPVDPFDYMTAEETDYLDAYLKELEELPAAADGEKEAVTLSAMAGDPDARERLIEIFLPQTAEIAKLYAGQGVFLEDLVGEGNVALSMAVTMLDCAENVQQAYGTIASMIMEAMETYIAENTQEKKTGEKIALRVNEVLERAEAMAQELGRKVTVLELSGETGMTPARILEAVRMSADKIDYLDTKEIYG